VNGHHMTEMSYMLTS